MFKLITSDHESRIRSLVSSLPALSHEEMASAFAALVEGIREDIPEKKRISYGRYNIVKRLGLFLYPLLKSPSPEELGRDLYGRKENGTFVKSLGIQLLTIAAEETGDLTETREYLERAASDEDWIVRVCSAGFVRKLVRKYPEAMHGWYLVMVTSDDPLKRRFASESLRLVADNTWLRKNPDFPFSILEHLYEESHEYPPDLLRKQSERLDAHR